jgi:membrane fusion protein (multidrug efflux system)
MNASVLPSPPPSAHDAESLPDETRSEHRPRKGRAWLIAILGIVAILAILVGVKASQIMAMINAGKHFVLPPESVTSTKVEKMEWTASRSAVGTLVAVHSVTVASELPGTVRQIAFESGASVHRGELLVRLDTSTEEAQLAAAEAQSSLARTNLGRASKLREEGANAPSDLDSAQSSANETAANSGVLRATIAKKSIRAPFDGRLGIRQVELGQVLAAGTAIASLQSVTPIYADFWLPEEVIADVKVGQVVRLRIADVYPKDTWVGSVTTVNPEVDTSTRNVLVRATFPNPDGRLEPGMFADVEVVSGAARAALVIPQTAVIYAPYGDAVFAIEEKDKTLTARQKFVRLGDRRGDLVEVVSGLSEGDVIVSNGAFKLHNGSAVILHNDLAPAAELAPKPIDDK